LKLQIDFDITKQELPVKWPSFFMLGSCFAQNQAERMAALGLDVCSNPYGIVYNPVSMEKILSRLVHHIAYTEHDFYAQNTVFSWEHHGDFKYHNVAQAVARSNELLSSARDFILKSDVVVLTFGTSLVHCYNGQIVANCHKMPNKEFEQGQLSFSQTKEVITQSLEHIKSINTKAHIILTLSPVRHLRSGVVHSSRSKATLLTAIHELITHFNGVSYFPSYEIFMDELRDYRFAKEDMTHPTTQAENYIWNRFCKTYFSSETLNILDHVTKYTQLAAHRPIHLPEQHLRLVNEKKNSLQNKYPFLRLK
jgi:hypothetical protein